MGAKIELELSSQGRSQLSWNCEARKVQCWSSRYREFPDTGGVGIQDELLWSGPLQLEFLQHYRGKSALGGVRLKEVVWGGGVPEKSFGGSRMGMARRTSGMISKSLGTH